MSTTTMSFDKKQPETEKELDDDDLDDLLDEFDEQVLSKPPGEDAESSSTNTKRPSAAPLNDEIKHNIEDLIKDLNIEDPEAKTQFEELVKQFEQTHADEARKALDPQNFDSVMKQTMERLKRSGETIDEQLKNDPASANPEDMLTQLLAGLGDGAGDGDFDMTKLLTDMLEELLSKEVLYEPIKDLNLKFPDFLKEKEGVISADQHAQYTKQYEITNEILAVFDAPGFDNENMQHRDKVNTLVESLQELGNPPPELVGDDVGIPGFGGAGADPALDFSAKDLPPGFEKQLEDGCKQT